MPLTKAGLKVLPVKLPFNGSVVRKNSSSLPAAKVRLFVVSVYSALTMSSMVAAPGSRKSTLLNLKLAMP